MSRADPADVRALVAGNPLAWVVPENGFAEASLLPLIGEYAEDGGLIALIGHLARSNPLHAALQVRPRALALFQGPHAYISPEHAGLRGWAPTWNYGHVVVDVQVDFTGVTTHAALDALIEEMEHGRAAPWKVAEMGPRYERLAGHIVGFRATVSRLRARMKYAQDERDTTLRSLLASELPDDVKHWMQRMNEDRL